MSYAAPADLVEAYGAREMSAVSTADGADMGLPDQARLQARLDDASDLMDSYLRRRYAVPVTPVTPVLRRCCCDLARKLLFETGATQPSDQVLAAAKAQREWLELIARGTVTLDGAATAGPLSGARVQDRAATFDRGSHAGVGRGWYR